MADIDLPVLKPETKTIEAKRDFAAGTWRQSLRISRVGSTTYLDEGNGAFVPKGASAHAVPANHAGFRR
jgi:hypothetical protein